MAVAEESDEFREDVVGLRLRTFPGVARRVETTGRTGPVGDNRARDRYDETTNEYSNQVRVFTLDRAQARCAEAFNDEELQAVFV